MEKITSVTKEQAIAVFVALGYEKAKTWPTGVLKSRLCKIKEKINEETEIAKDTSPETEELLNNIIDLPDGAVIEIAESNPLSNALETIIPTEKPIKKKAEAAKKETPTKEKTEKEKQPVTTSKKKNTPVEKKYAPRSRKNGRLDIALNTLQATEAAESFENIATIANGEYVSSGGKDNIEEAKWSLRIVMKILKKLGHISIDENGKIEYDS